MYYKLCVFHVKDSEKELAERNMRNRTVSELENDDSQGQSHDLREIDEVDAESEMPNNECAIMVWENSRRQNELLVYRYYNKF